MRDSPEKSLGILLTRGPAHPDSARALGLAAAAANEGIGVSLFLMTDGVDVLASPDALALDRDHVRVVACTLSTFSRDAPTDLPFVDYAGQFQLAEIIRRCDRFLSFA